MVDLDDQTTIEKLDASDALGIVSDQYAQLQHDFDFKLKLAASPRNIVLAGMGGSALAGTVLKAWLDDELCLPIEITRDYSAQGYVGPDTIFVASSYSGNTEETLSALSQAEQQQARVVIMASGGKLADIAAAKSYPLLELPAGLQPRYATLYGLKALLVLLSELGVVGHDHLDQLAAASMLLKDAYPRLTADIATDQNQAKQIARQLYDKTPIIYGGPLMKAAAYKWKISCNENAKNLAFWDEWSEFDHNEFLGWSSKPAGESFAVVELHSSLEHPQIKRRYEVSRRLLKGHMPEPIQVQAEGMSRIEQLLWAMQLGDFVSIYLAFLNGLDPTPVTLMEKLKKNLA